MVNYYQGVENLWWQN